MARYQRGTGIEADGAVGRSDQDHAVVGRVVSRSRPELSLVVEQLHIAHALRHNYKCAGIGKAYGSSGDATGNLTVVAGAVSYGDSIIRILDDHLAEGMPGTISLQQSVIGEEEISTAGCCHAEVALGIHAI